MPPENYSFLDVAVLDAVRQRFAAGNALAILSSDLEQVIWANGPGASMFGYPDIEAIIGASARLPLIARRQIMATSGFPDIGSDRAITVRLATGIVSRAVGFLASAVTMPDGEKAIMLAVPAAQTSSRSAGEIASRAIGGFTEAGHFIAFVDAQGGVEAASDGFAALGIERRTLAALVADVTASGDRLVKRLVPGTGTSYPAGFARLTDTRHLLVVIDEDQLDDQGDHPAGVTAMPSGESPDVEPSQDISPAPAVVAVERAEVPQAAAEEDAQAAGEPVAAKEPEAAPPSFESSVAAAGTVADQQPTETDHQANAVEAGPRASEAGQHDHWYFNTGDDDARQAEPEAPTKDEPAEVVTAEDRRQEVNETAARETIAPAQPASPRDIDRSAPPLRFVWRTDAEGKFSALSPEFAEIVGQPAADVIGRRFKDVATTFGLDASGEIAGLLERRDTWSGRSVLWPVAGTGLKIPVDLAALPVYGRSRAFEGFRGFGVARAADAVVDPEALGMALVPNAAPTGPAPAGGEPSVAKPTAEPEQPKPEDPFQGEVPALTIVPKPERRFADKVIRLAEHRQPANDKQPGNDTPHKGLSILERSAFREIGERLRRDSSAPAEPGLAEADKQSDATVAGKDDAAAKEPTGEVPAAASRSPAPEAAEHESSVNEATLPSAPEASETVDSKADAETAEAQTEAEDQKDLARLDGIDDAAETSDTSRPETPVVSGSLLSYADGEKSTEAAGAEPVSEDKQAASAQHAVEHGAAEPRQSAEQPMAQPVAAEPPARDAADDDSMTADDFRDAQDSEDWAGSDADAATTASDKQPEEPVVLVRPRLEVPPLKLSGFVPSAFSTGEETKAPDTSILARLPVPLLIHSGDMLHYANEAFLELTGYDALDDLTDAGGLGALFADPYAEDAAADESDHSLKLKTRQGQEFPIDALLRSVPWRGGKALMLVVRRSGEDDAAHFTAANDEPALQPDVPELKSRIAEMRTIIDTATDGVVLIGRDGNIRSISRPAEALFGFDSDEVAGKPFASLFAIESQRAARDYLAGLSEAGVASVLNDGREVIGREAQGRFIPLFMTIGRLPNDSGFCAVVRDITQWKRAEEDLTQARAVAERASSQKTDFLARISHEIRTPLNAIIGFSELMVDEKFGPVANDRYRDYLRDINRSGNHVLDLVNDLLDISKIEAGQQEMDYEAVSLNDTLAETVAMMQPQANRERVIIRSSFASRLPEVVADLRSVRQIALNILSNAIRYTQAGGQVIVSTAYEASGDVVMRVRDTGIGMTQAEIEQALKPFKQINALKRGRGDGTGLGLPLTKAMVEANRARFTITSTPGEGTLVEVGFPSTRVLAE
ncbi:PAS domain S-box protein [Mesorhizobium sp. M2D.F.Ca.ET.185.01.1.1]|uniref:PAS domain S-box protein n=2 Tax=Mesorhizobium TaxID=68287 RepID=UPI000FCAAB6D|nr:MULTISPECIES: PAS domain S-box protein [unclassified Mesorhizobium]TGP72976.1 PAS domain S-box protein [bacterium M00.F.Ca.ET.227.01.1.1]TGP85137.1 PAS domain S-box protein [bacterium M00.F.Ca.ET.221.01.1.1]TGP89220.1 PAS domain S-box protein [bacterium M00.F.Ca.ET.222.01.1.1]TGU12708.1 PAS domain S-box protein [bacterium M00.F.Ca.ET.163.01.1.1]TGU18734.1 PAS domain S-box protein [bacterium M00.F.Ca.ET.156.01.1.1]TGU43786.1 PAS domain S-box protein [bacterium M00.F.Ca.ET.146.01.1.1]TGV670